jgi:hypothetical protein
MGRACCWVRCGIRTFDDLALLAPWSGRLHQQAIGRQVWATGIWAGCRDVRAILSKRRIEGPRQQFFTIDGSDNNDPSPPPQDFRRSYGKASPRSCR